MVNNEPYVAIDKKEAIFVIGISLCAIKGGGMWGRCSESDRRIGNLDKVASVELGKCYRAPEGLLGWLSEKNDAIVGDGQGLTDTQ